MSSAHTKSLLSLAILGRRIVWLLLLIVGLVVAGLGILFLRSDIGSFQPRLPTITQKLEVQRTATPTLPPFLIRCLRAEGAADHFTARCLLIQFGLNETTALRWHMRTWLWSWSLWWHFSEVERDLLYCACLHDGVGKTGIHHLSARLFGRPIEKLTEQEMAVLSVASRAPAYCLKNRPKLTATSEELLRRVKAE